MSKTKIVLIVVCLLSGGMLCFGLRGANKWALTGLAVVSFAAGAVVGSNNQKRVEGLAETLRKRYNKLDG